MAKTKFTPILITVKTTNEAILLKSKKDMKEKLGFVWKENAMDFINYLNNKYGIFNYEMKNV